MIDNSQKTQMMKNNVVKALSLSPEDPWNQTTPEALGPCIMEHMRREEPYFRKWAENWYMTMQYVFGQHNFRWSRRNGFAVDFDWLRQRKNPSGYVRAYTNIARIAVESLSAGLYSNMPSWDVEATDPSATGGRRQKKIIGRLLDGLFETLQADKDVSAAAFIFSLFGQVAFDSGWNPMSGRVIETPRYMKQQATPYTTWMANNPVIPGGMIETPTPVRDAQGKPYLENTWNFARDAMGRQIIDRIFTGNPNLGVLTPFEYCRGVGTVGMHKTPYVRIYRLLDYDKWLDCYGQMAGKTRNFDAIEPVYGIDSVYQFALRFFMRMMFVTPPAGEEYGTRWGSTMTGNLRHKVFVVEHYDQPHPLKWPEGRRVIVANGQCTHINKPDYNTNKLDGWHPLSEAQWINNYPSSISSGPMQDLVKKNQELNVMDSFIATAMRRSLGGQYLVKVGSGIDPNRLTGEPGMSHEVTDPYGIRILHDELAIPPVVAEIRAMQKQDAYDQAGSLESQRGKPDEGTSGYQTKLFEEREEKRLAPARKSFRNAVAAGGEKLIYALHANAFRLDDALMGYLMANAAGDFTADDVVSFMSKPLAIGTQIRVVENSMVFKSSASKKADWMQMLQQNPALVQRLTNDATVLDAFLKEFDMEELRDASAPQRDRAEAENAAFEDMFQMGQDLNGIRRPVVLLEDDDNIHMASHANFFCRYFDRMRDNPQALFEFIVHQEKHRIQQQEKANQVMMGASLAVPQMITMAGQQQPPNPMQIAQDTIQRQQMQAKMGPDPAQEPKQMGSPQGAAPKSAGAPAKAAKPPQQETA